MSRPVALARASEIRTPPPPGAPYSVALDGSEEEGRSKVYRHWRFKDGLLESLDPQVCPCVDGVEGCMLTGAIRSHPPMTSSKRLVSRLQLGCYFYNN